MTQTRGKTCQSHTGRAMQADSRQTLNCWTKWVLLLLRTGNVKTSKFRTAAPSEKQWDKKITKKTKQKHV